MVGLGYFFIGDEISYPKNVGIIIKESQFDIFFTFGFVCLR